MVGQLVDRRVGFHFFKKSFSISHVFHLQKSISMVADDRVSFRRHVSQEFGR